MPYPYTIHLQSESGADVGKVSVTLDDDAIDYITSFPYGGIDAVIHEVVTRLYMARAEMIYQILAIKKGEADEATKRAKEHWQACEAERSGIRVSKPVKRGGKRANRGDESQTIF